MSEGNAHRAEILSIKLRGILTCTNCNLSFTLNWKFTFLITETRNWENDTGLLKKDQNSIVHP